LFRKFVGGRVRLETQTTATAVSVVQVQDRNWAMGSPGGDEEKETDLKYDRT
jgi:hypothetical protein